MRSRILITGGTGFLGKRLALALKHDFDVTLASRNNKQNLVAERMTGCRVLPMDVTNIESVRDAIAETMPDIVIHAAATKFVDLSEKQPMECVDVNVVGSQNVARVAVDKGVGVVLGISTDKAAPPIRNIYGLSKATMERLFCSMDGKTATRFMCVRYGNVAWSTGSVLPIWKRMHQETGVLRSTGPDMTRFFFTVEEAARLVLTGLEHINALHGTVLSRAMKSARIRDVLDVWVSEKGGRWEPMEGRPGDRPYEWLIADSELEYTRLETFRDIPHYVISFNRRVTDPLKHAASSDNAERLSRNEIAALIAAVPPEEQ